MAVTGALVEQYASPAGHDRAVLPLITARPALRDAFLAAAAEMTDPLAAALAGRLGAGGRDRAEVLAASVAAAVRIALRRWIAPAEGGLVVVSGSLPQLITAALAPLAPALDARPPNEQPLSEREPGYPLTPPWT